jgi:hypothetical protein
MATYLSICGGIFIFMKCREISEADIIDIHVIHASVLQVITGMRTQRQIVHP